MERKEFRLFVSSTFTDLVDEREYLVKHIFPEIKAAARERSVEFTEIDLRWGITVHEVQEGKTIKTGRISFVATSSTSSLRKISLSYTIKTKCLPRLGT